MGILLFMTIIEENKKKSDLYHISIYLFMLLSTGCASLFIFLNGSLDKSNPDTWQAKVINKTSYRGGQSVILKTNINVHIYQLPVLYGFYKDININDSINLTVKPGKFNFPWVVSYEKTQ